MNFNEVYQPVNIRRHQARRAREKRELMERRARETREATASSEPNTSVGRDWNSSAAKG